jgi:hypothetical protein
MRGGTGWPAVLRPDHFVQLACRQVLRTLGGGVCAQERPGLVVLMIELENALAQMATNAEPTKLWSPYRQPLAKFLNKYTAEVLPCALRALCPLHVPPPAGCDAYTAEMCCPGSRAVCPLPAPPPTACDEHTTEARPWGGALCVPHACNPHRL